MNFETDKDMVVFNRIPDGEPSGFSVLKKGKYEVKIIKPMDRADKELTWYKIKGTKLFFAFNRKKLPVGIAFSETIPKPKTLLLK